MMIQSALLAIRSIRNRSCQNVGGGPLTPLRSASVSMRTQHSHHRHHHRHYYHSLAALAIGNHHPFCVSNIQQQSRFYSISATAYEQDSTTPTSPTTTTTTSSTTKPNELQSNLKPTQIVAELDKYVVGQQDAKRAVAIALRNRWRRRQLPEDLRKEIMPRNVLLVGPTGCGKTEVARRMAMLNDAPFIKVEATKFTEVGYHGRDVDKIIVDLVDIGMQLTRKRETEKVKERAKEIVEEVILDKLMGPAIASTKSTSSSSTVTTTTIGVLPSSSANDNKGNGDKKDDTTTTTTTTTTAGSSNTGRDSFREMLRDGLLEEQEIEVDVPQQGGRAGEFSWGGAGDGTSSGTNYVSMKISMDADSSGKAMTQRKKLTVAEGRKVLMEAEIEKLLQTIDLRKEAITAVEETGIVFIDEIDKICTSSGSFGRNTDASAEGVQRDLLPLVEGTTISTKHGNVNTDYILFVASGAFHSVKPSDLLPELQGRLPVRVELKGLTEDDLYRILTEPVANMIQQQIALLKTEGVELVFEDEAIREIARMAAELNKSVENIGARRLHTVLERIMEEISFQAAEEEMQGKRVVVDKAIIDERLKDVQKNSDLSRFIL